MYEVDAIALLAREVLRGRMPTLIAEACAWSVGLSDRPHHLRRHGRVTPTGLTLGMRAAAEQQLGGEEDARLELADAPAGSFGDLLNALTSDGGLYAELLDEQVLTPFVLQTCVLALQRARAQEPAAYAELLDELDDDGSDPVELVRVAEWEAPLKTEAEQLLLAALAHVPLVEVEAEGLPLSLVRAAEGITRGAVVPAPVPDGTPDEGELAGTLFLASAALRAAGLPLPVPPSHAEALVTALLAEGLLLEELPAVLPHLPVQPDTAAEVEAIVAAAGLGL